MAVAGGVEPEVTAPAVGGDVGRLGDVGGDEPLEVRARRRGEGLEPQPASWRFLISPSTM
jgi:hypothetical protein